jgi:hypothetical protein
MIYKDWVYGTVKIEDEVILDLMNTNAVQRLKGINQGGPLFLLNPNHFLNKYKTTRFDHSVGVCILLKIFNASLEEQIAGLLHDISHMVFSHATDFLFNRNMQQDYHEIFHEKIILNSDIPSVLKKYNINVKDILDNKKFTLLERNLPDLCADRIDYFLRDMCVYDSLIKKKVNEILNSFTVFKKEIVFTSLDSAKLFAQKFIEANKMLYCNPLQSSLFKIISDVLKSAMSKGFIIEDDLFSTDNLILEKLRNSNDEEIIDKLNLISNMEVIENKNNYDFHLKSKVRCVDPKIIADEKLVRLSDLDESYKKTMNDFISKTSNGFFTKIIKKNFN